LDAHSKRRLTIGTPNLITCSQLWCKLVGRHHKKETGKEEENIEKDINIHNLPILRKNFTHWLKSLGPGVITGASDDDTSGIATYSQAGAQFGFGMLWMALFQYPMMTVIQEMCARIGLLTGAGLTTVIKRKYSNKVALPLSSLLLIANTINIGADIGAMAASVRLVLPELPIIVATVSFTVFIVASQTNSSTSSL
jgi:Mn2+/Fe2+ NRAMP family transporter